MPNPTPNADAAPVADESRQATRSSFNRAVKDGLITDAVMDSFGDGYGEPYNPDRKAYGTFDGRKVWAWVSPGHPQAEVGWILNDGFPGKPKSTEPDAAPVVEPTLQERLRGHAILLHRPHEPAGFKQIGYACEEAADRLDHLEAREREGRELGQTIRKQQQMFTETKTLYRNPGDYHGRRVAGAWIKADILAQVLTHLDGGSTND